MQSNKQHNFVSQMILISLYLQQPQTEKKLKKRLKHVQTKEKPIKIERKVKALTFHKEWDLDDQ